jgi:hypothetical protein
MAPGSLLWFARHELRLAWRDAVSMITAGRPAPARKAAIAAVVILAGLHGVAFLTLRLTCSPEGHVGEHVTCSPINQNAGPAGDPALLFLNQCVEAGCGGRI